jgi:glycogen operon protein
MDSLRYWVLEMHVDGFRFDLASTLARELHDVDRLGAFFDIIHQDPVLSQVKLIAEPWDLGERIPGGKLPAALVGVERQVPRLRRDYWRGADATLVRSSATG